MATVELSEGAASESNDALAAAELIDSLEEWFCQGGVTTQVGDFLSAAAQLPAFAGFAEAEENVPDTDDANAHVRMAQFAEYGELIDALLDHFVSHLVEDEAAKETVARDIATIVVALVDDESKRHFTCVPFIAGALDHAHFFRLIADTQCMLGGSLDAGRDE